MGVSMAYEIRIYPNAAQRELAERTFGCCRWVYNRCLETCKDAYEETGKSPTRWQLDKMLPGWKAEFPWLKRRIPSLWTNSYFVSTVGGAPLSIVKQYIENQKKV